MGEGADRVSANGKELAEVPEVIEGRIGLIRHELGELVAELDRRRHEATDIRLQMKRHPMIAGAAAVTVAAAIGGVIAFAIWNARRRERPAEKARRARRAMQRLMDDPDHMAREPSVTEKILAAAGTAAASLLVKRAFDRAMPARS
jgi:hypothetical protein